MNSPRHPRTRSQAAAGRSSQPTNPAVPSTAPAPPASGTTAPSSSGVTVPGGAVTSSGGNPIQPVGDSFNVGGAMTTIIHDVKLTEKLIGEWLHEFLTVDAFLEAVGDVFTLKRIADDAESLRT
jgi:hypothetical protein